MRHLAWAFLFVTLTAPSASAQGLSSDQILKQLSPPQPTTRTRSLGGPPPEDAAAKARRTRAIQILEAGAPPPDPKTTPPGAPPPVVVVKPEHQEEFKKIKAELPKIDLKITFHYNSVQPTPEGEQQLHQLGLALQKMVDGKFSLIGHTDARGSDDYNLVLSQRRAAAVVAILISKYNIPLTRMIPSGQGEKELLAGLPPEHEANRRVEVINLGL